MLETACFTPASALAAAKTGTSRIELCASYSLGGTTPQLAHLTTLQTNLRAAHLATPVFVMIRPRGGDFVYSAAEFAQMQRSIAAFKDAGAQGFVFGVLTQGGEVDGERCRVLVRQAAPVGCTFHRAIDRVVDLEAGVERVVGCGFLRVLMSGGSDAGAGRERVREMQGKYGERVEIVLGGGVRSWNVLELKRETGVQWVHSAAITGAGEEVDEEEVRKLVALLGDT